MADIVHLPAIPAAEDPQALLLDIRRRLAAGEDIGSRVVHIRQAAAATRAYAGGLRRVLEAPDDRLAAEPGLMAVGAEVLALAERNVAAAEELLRLFASRPP
jgi:hypothetical protein